MGLGSFVSSLFGGGGGGSDTEARLARETEEARQRRIREGTSRVNSLFDSGFGEDFFGGRRSAYTDFAMPQLEDQYDDASEQLTFSLARSGLGNSTVAGDKRADLSKRYQTGLQDIQGSARDYEIDARNAVEGARGDIISMLQSTADVSGAVSSAQNRAAALSKMPSFSPLGQLFTDATALAGQQAALERAESATGRDYARYDTGLFNVPKSAVRTT